MILGQATFQVRFQVKNNSLLLVAVVFLCVCVCVFFYNNGNVIFDALQKDLACMWPPSVVRPY